MNEGHDPKVTTDLPSAPADSPGGADPLRTTDPLCGAATTDQLPPDADAPTGGFPAVPGYRVLREIARGGMGRVLAAYDLTLDRDVALKILLPGANADRFVRESKITARLPHPGIPPVHALGTLADGSPFLAMKLIGGRTLAHAMKTADRPRLLQAFLQVCQAVGFAHSHGVIHRDLKPANVMVGAFGEVQVMDWGLAKNLAEASVASEEPASRELERPEDRTDPNQTTDYRTAGEPTDDRTQAGQVLGTPAYMAPEQARGEATDARADVFALGGILCAILTGQPPFGGKTNREVIRRAGAADLAEAHGRLDGCGADAELVSLCRRCLNPDPTDRPADGQAVADGVTAYQSGVQEKLRKAELAEAAAKAKAAEEAKRRRVTLALAATVLLALTLGGGGYFYVKNERDARQAQVVREVNDALNQAAALRENAKANSVGGAALFAQAREQAQRALALLENGPADAALQDQVRRLKAQLDEEEKDRKLVAALDEARLAQGEMLSEDRFAWERAVPLFRDAFRAYGLPVGEVEPEVAAERIRQRPAAVREVVVAALDEWDAAMPAWPQNGPGAFGNSSEARAGYAPSRARWHFCSSTVRIVSTLYLPPPPILPPNDSLCCLAAGDTVITPKPNWRPGQQQHHCSTLFRMSPFVPSGQRLRGSGGAGCYFFDSSLLAASHSCRRSMKWSAPPPLLTKPCAPIWKTCSSASPLLLR
jgi:hypothetical protein